MKFIVQEQPELYSIIHVDNPVIVPGGRFREFYYWDSYWIILGLLHTEMVHTAKGMLQNFLSIVDRYGFIPNGGRIYYLGRSQPPLLIPMVKAYVDATNDEEFIKSSVATLDMEFQYWMNNHMENINGYDLAKYGDNTRGPRPESYREDIETSNDFVTDAEKEEHYAELKAGAESGMDFSSRWFISRDGTNSGSLVNIKCRSIIPVELNAILFWNANTLAEFYLRLGNTAKSAQYENKAQELYQAIQAVLWDDEEGAWFDYDILNAKKRKYFVPTNLAPLWTKCFNHADRNNITEKVLRYIAKENIDSYVGGVPNSLAQTGEQWDFPNVWPPMQHMLIVGLNNLENEKTNQMAFNWASKWVYSNFVAYKPNRHMFEKVDIENIENISILK